MKPNFSPSREVLLTLIVIFLLGIAIMVSLALLAFLFSGNISALKVLLPPTRVHPTAAPFIPTKDIRAPAPTSTAPTIIDSTAVLPTLQDIVPATPETAIPDSTAAIPTLDYRQPLAEVGLLETSRSGFGTSVNIKVSVHNFGTLPFTLSKSNVTLTQTDGKTLALKSSNPDLPQEFQPGETKTI